MLKYCAYALITLLATIATFILAPIVAWPDRDRLPRYLIWMQTFDAGLNNYWERRYADWLRRWFDQDYYDAHQWLRAYCRMLWLWRNPAYYTALWLGFDQTGLEYTADDDPVDARWENPVTYRNVRLRRRFTNTEGQAGFLYRARFFYTSKRYVEAVLGWKVPWDSEQKAMLAVRVTPFRSIP